MPGTKLSIAEKMILLLVAVMIATGYSLMWFNKPAFAFYVDEDSVVEWLTVVGLLAGSVLCFYRFVKFIKQRKWIFLLMTFLAGLVLFGGAGEEVSWGQRMFHIKSPEYFQEYNTQKELNFHNLEVYGVKINKVVFSIGLTLIFAIFLLVFPVLYRRKSGMRLWMDSWGLPLPKNYQIISFLLVFLLTTLMRNEKSDELFECGEAFMIFLVILSPFNSHIYKKKK